MKKLTELPHISDQLRLNEDYIEDFNNNHEFNDPFLHWSEDKTFYKSTAEKLEKFLDDDDDDDVNNNNVCKTNFIRHSADEDSLSDSGEYYENLELISENETKKNKKPKRLKTGNFKSLRRKFVISSKRKKKSARIIRKKEPLPMKLRALPKSFWQQPNIPNILSPGEVYPVLPIFPPLAANSKEVVNLVEPKREEGIVSDANTDLLFSLFCEVEAKQRKLRGQKVVSFVKRGRPKKAPISSISKTILKDEDPCLVSTVTDFILPLIPVEKVAPNSLEARIAEGEQVLAMVSLNENDQQATSRRMMSGNLEHGNYSEILTDLVFQL